jgi:hypothetical protein
LQAPQQGLDLSGFLILIFFASMMYVGFKKLKVLKRQEVQAKLREGGFGDGFL